MEDDKLKELEIRVLDLNYRVKSVELIASSFNAVSLFFKNNKALIIMTILIISSIFYSNVIIMNRISTLQGNINKYTKSVFIKTQEVNK